jgi:hypothetical protein
MKSAEDILQEVIWYLRDTSHAITTNQEIENSQEFVKAITPHLLRSFRVALRMVQLDPEQANLTSYGCAQEVAMAQALFPLIKTDEEFPDPPVQEEEPEE